MIYVVNAVGTSDKKYPYSYDSWLDFWEKKTNKLDAHCRNCGKPAGNLCGEHVQKVEQHSDGLWYRAQDYILSPSAQNASILKTTKFFMLMKKNW